MTDDEIRNLLKDLYGRGLIQYNQLSKALTNPRSGKPFNHAYIQQYVERSIPARLDHEVRSELLQKLSAMEHLEPPAQEPSRAVGRSDYDRPSNTEANSTMEHERQEIIAIMSRLDRAGLRHLLHAAKAQLALQERELGSRLPLAKRVGP